MKRDESRRLGDYEVHKAWEGFASVRQVSSGEIMHSRTSPMDEARQLYVEQSFLGERLRENAPGREPLVIWDVGLGAGIQQRLDLRGVAAHRRVDQLHVEVLSVKRGSDKKRQGEDAKGHQCVIA